MVITLTTSSFVQPSPNGNPAVYLATDPSWVDKAELKVADALMYDLKAISFIVNEISNTTGFVEKLATYLDENGDLLNNVILGSPDIAAGNKYLMSLRYKFVHKNNGTVKYGATEVVSTFINSHPVTPTGIAGTVRAEDSGISINIGSFYTFNSQSDGYDAIKYITYYISEIGSDISGGLIIGDLPITIVDGNPIYNKWLTIQGLDNSTPYEVAYRVSNGVAGSELSETINITPSDLPAVITVTTARNNFNDINSSIDSATTSIIKFYWAKPSDYAELLAGDTPVTKYTIKKQEVAWNEEENAYEPVGEPTVTDLPHDAYSASRPSYELTTPLTDAGSTYHYVHPFNNTSSDFGKIFQFMVFASNSNGDGPESGASNKIASYVNPLPQPFELENVTEVAATIGVPVNVHTGALKLVLTNLSELNGMTDIIESVDVSGVVQDNGTDQFKTQQVKMKLVIQSTATTPVTIYDGDVYFEREYSEALETIDDVEVNVGTLLNKWSIEDIATDLSFNTSLVLGTKYKYTLNRLGKDPINPDTIELKSISNEVLRTHFESPEAIDFIQAYSFNDDFTPVMVNGFPAIRILFKQLEIGAMNGTEAFITETNNIEYEIRSNSQTIPGMDRIEHSGVETVRQFIVQSTLGTVNNLYVRVYIKHTELVDLEIEGKESSPSVQESAKTYPDAVSNVTSVVDPAGTSVTVTWLKQSFGGLGGFPSANVKNRAYLINDTDPTDTVLTQDLSHSAAQEAIFTGLTVGDVYKLYVLPIGQYSKSSFDNPAANKFENSEIRKHFVTSAITAVGTPGVPTNVDAYPASDKITFNYDEPTELRGNSIDNFEYHFIVNSDETHFPYQDEYQTLVQASVASVAGSSEAVVFNGYTAVAESNSRANATSLVNGDVYRYALYVVSSGGDEAIENLTDVLESSNGTALTLVPVSRTPTFDLRGDLAISDDFVLISTGVQKPEISATAAAGEITISINKPLNNPPTELVIVLDDNDALGADLNPIPSFSTINVREARADGNGGLFSLSSATDKNIGEVEYGEDGYDFVVNNNQSGGQTYSVTIRNLVNGRTHKVQARYANTYNGFDFYSEVATVLIAAEAPPTPPENATFEVDDKTIFLNWYQPLNSGGAGVGTNGELLYQVNVSTGSTQVLQLTNLSNTSLTLDATNFSAIENSITYSVQISAYYIKGGNEVKSAAASIPVIKPNVAPESPVVTLVRGSNALSVSITTVDAAQSALYPLTSLDIYYKQSNETEYTTSATSFTANINTGTQSLEYEIANLFNGQSYDVKIVPVKAYNYAQSPASVLISNQIPFGAPVVNASTATAVVGNSKAIRLTVELKGSGSIKHIIALGKSANSSSIGILNLLEGTLPTITRSGTQDGSVAGNQIATLILDFASTIPFPLSDAIIIVNTDYGTDAAAYAVGSTGYFTDGV